MKDKKNCMAEDRGLTALLKGIQNMHCLSVCQLTMEHGRGKNMAPQEMLILLGNMADLK